MRKVFFWQRLVSPHISGLAVALAEQGCEVVYAAVQPLTRERVEQGWSLPSLDGVRVELVPTLDAALRLIDRSPLDFIHICSGVRGNGLIGDVQRLLAQRRLRHWIIIETVDDSGWRGFVRRFFYRWSFAIWQQTGEGVLAIGNSTLAWMSARGVLPFRLFPFAYFLSSPLIASCESYRGIGRFRILFVGQFIELKRLDHLVGALAGVPHLDFELAVVGSGPLEGQWRNIAEAALPGRVDWIGRLPLENVPAEMARADCLVLPSRHDGWGAVVSEALMVGTPVICSDACGSSGVVRSSRHGGVFPVGDVRSLARLLAEIISKGRLRAEERSALASWAVCLGGQAGAHYLLEIFRHMDGAAERPVPPWAAAREAV